MNKDIIANLANFSINRDERGKFSVSDFGEKKMRSARLTDEAWDKLEEKANALGITRTDLIEILARDTRTEREIVIKALQNFIERKRSEYGQNPAQRGKEFTQNTRDWHFFNKFMALVESEAHELGLDVIEQPCIDTVINSQSNPEKS